METPIYINLMFSYPFVFLHDFSHIITDGAHNIIAQILHLKELLEPGDQQRVVCRFREKFVHHCLKVQLNRMIRCLCHQ